MSFDLLSISLKSYGRILSLSIGVMLAVSLITGISVGVETVSGSVLRSYMNRLPYDVTAAQDNNYDAYANVSRALSQADMVYHVEPVFQWSPINLYNLTGASFALTSNHGSLTPRNASVTMLGLGDNFPQQYGATLLSGAFNLADGVVLPETTAETLGVSSGDKVNLTVYYTVPSNSSIKATPPPGTTVFYTLTWNVNGIVSLSDSAETIIQPKTQSDNTAPLGMSTLLDLTSHSVIMSGSRLVAAYQFFLTNTGASLSTASVLHRVFLRRDKIVNLFDPAGMVRNLQLVVAEMQARTAGYKLEFLDSLAKSVADYQGWLTTNEISFYLFSLPVLVVSWYATMTVWFLSTGRRRRTYGLLKIRGMSTKEIFRTSMLDAFVIGAIGSTFGILAGYLTGSIVAGILDGSPIFRLNLQAVTVETSVIGLIVGTLISVLGAVQPASIAAHLQPVDAEKSYRVEEVETPARGPMAWSWIALCLAVYKMLEWLLNFSPATLFPLGSPSNNFFVFILFSLWIFVSGILTFLAPFLFIYAATMILVRSQFGLHRSVHHLLKRYLRELTDVADRAVSKNPARITRVTFLVTLTLSFGVFASITAATSGDLQARTVKLSVGSDINLKVFLPGTNSAGWSTAANAWDLNETFAKKLASLSGVQSVAPIVEGYATSEAIYGSETVIVYGVDTQNLLGTAYDTEDFLVESSPFVSQGTLNLGNGTLVSQTLWKALKLSLVHVFELNETNPNNEGLIPLRIAGFYKYLPGVDSLLTPVKADPRFPSPVLGSIVIDMALLRAINLTNIVGYTFLVRTMPEANLGGLVNSIRSLTSRQLFSITTLEAGMQSLRTTPSTIAPLTFLQLCFAYLLAASAVGSALTSWGTIRARAWEVAVLRTRGASTGQSFRLLLSETALIIIISMLIAIPMGLLEAYSVISFLTSSASSSALSTLTFEMQVPLEVGAILFVAASTLLLSSVLPAWLIIRKPPSEMFRIR